MTHSSFFAASLSVEPSEIHVQLERKKATVIRYISIDICIYNSIYMIVGLSLGEADTA